MTDKEMLDHVAALALSGLLAGTIRPSFPNSKDEKGYVNQAFILAREFIRQSRDIINVR